MSAIRNLAFVSNFPPATRYVTLALLATSTLSLLLRSTIDPDLKRIGFGLTGEFDAFSSWLLLIPGNALWRPWTLFTAAFVETSVVEMIITAITLALAGRYLERMWGYKEFLKFSAVVIIASNIVATAVNIIEHVVIDSGGTFLYGQPYHGMMALQAGFLVAFTQLIPEHHVQFFGGLAKLKVKQLPMLYVTVSNVMCIIGLQSPFILIQFGWFFAWAYLRFVKDGGDRSETFSLSSWFPPFIRPYVSKLANFVFGLAIRFRVIKPWTDIESGLPTSSPGNARAEAERRRALALQALDQRLASSKPAQPVPLSTLPTGPSPQTSMSRSQSASAVHQPTSPVQTTHAKQTSATGSATGAEASIDKTPVSAPGANVKDSAVVFDADKE